MNQEQEEQDIKVEQQKLCEDCGTFITEREAQDNGNLCDLCLTSLKKL